jgi:hypothetical protein
VDVRGKKEMEKKTKKKGKEKRDKREKSGSHGTVILFFRRGIFPESASSTISTIVYLTNFMTTGVEQGWAPTREMKAK